MSKPVYAKKVDANQAEVIQKLRELPGVTVQDLSSLGNGCPDFIVGWLGNNYLIELKDGEKAKHQKKLTPAEDKFFKTWKGNVHKCESFEDVFRVITGQWMPEPN